ncbi:methyltransferase [Massilia sp. TWP1-3-3]|uniref:methyltransferase n=1 Tax=Massilia sp. TWP1-3-3 TaxID=2804573 RepID=UPI003CF1D65B
MTALQDAPRHSLSGPAAPFATATAARGAALLALGLALKQRAYAFTTVTPATHARVNARADARRSADLAGIFGWSRPFCADVPDAELLQCMRDAGVVTGVDDADGALLSQVRASTLDGQLYFHSAFPTSASDAVFFGPDTYRFIRALRGALAAFLGPITRAVDIGCGAGSGAMTIALAHPGATVFAADINQAALNAAAINARLASVTNLLPVHSDLLSGLDGDFDLIVSNPPYLLDREQRAYRHGGGDLGAGLSVAIVEQAVARLAPGGMLALYTGVAMVDTADPFRASAESLLGAAGFRWTYEEIDPDVFGEELAEPAYQHTDRIAAVFLCASKPVQGE